MKIILLLLISSLRLQAQNTVTNEVIVVKVSLQCTNCLSIMIHAGENKAKNIFITKEPGTLLIVNPNIYKCSKCTNAFESLEDWPKIEYKNK